MSGTPWWQGSMARAAPDQKPAVTMTAVLTVRDHIELAPGFIGIPRRPVDMSGLGRLPQPLILNKNAGVVLAEINRRMRLPIGVRVRAVAAERRDHRADRDVGLALDLRAGRPRRSVTDVRRRLRERDALSRADALAQKVRVAMIAPATPEPVPL